MAQLSSSTSVKNLGVDRTQVATFLSDSNASLQIGRVLYPRFFSRGVGLASTHPWPAYERRDFPRMGFLLLSQNREDAIFRTRNIPDPFRQGADAIVLGCQRDTYLDVRLILFPESDSAYLSEPLTIPCNETSDNVN